MHTHTLKDWVIATRPWSFPASTMPVLVTLGYLFWQNEHMNWLHAVWALVGIVVFHAAGNTWSDYFDYARHVDASDTHGSRTLTSGQFTPAEIYRFSWILLGAALVLGIGLLLSSGIHLLWFGLGGAACSLLYPALKFRAWGDVVILFSYALLPTLGTTYAVSGHVVWDVLWLALPVGLITVAILHANNTRDIRTDRRAGISTLAMRLGIGVSTRLYCLEVLLPFVWMAGLVVAGVLPLWTLGVIPALLPALANARLAMRLRDESQAEVIACLDERTAKLQLVFSLLTSVTLFTAGGLA